MSRNGESTKQEQSEAASPSAPRPNAKNVKKESLLEEGGSSDDDAKPICLKKLKSVAKEAKKPIAKEKKEESDDDQNKKTKTKTKKKSSTSDKLVKPKSEGVTQVLKKEKKVYDLPGQKRDPPEERDPTRIFYETLYQQVPTSEMAQIWLMECGLLPANVAKEVFGKKQKKAQTLRSPAKTHVSSAKNTSAKSVTIKKELSTATKSSKSVTVKKEQPSSADAVKKKKSLSSTKKRKAADESDEDGSDDDFEVILQPKKRKLAG